MGSSTWSRLSGLANLISTMVRGLGFIQRGRTAAADSIRQTVPAAREGFSLYCGLLVLLGMVTAGFVVLPLGLLLLLQGVLHDSVDRQVLGGLALSLLGLFYLVVPLLVLQVATRLVFGRLERRVGQFADRVEGRR